jgi:cell migration-inducing and hyaluronan-binding protein
MEKKWSNDDYGNAAWKTAVFADKDGSVTGVPKSYIVIKGGIFLDEACEEKPTWNAAVCTGDVGRMNVGGGAGGGGGRGAAGAGAAKGGPGGPGAAKGAPAAPAPLAAGAGAAKGGPGGPGAAKGGGPPAGAFANRGFDVAPAQPPVILSRNGKDFPVNGATNVRAGTEFKVATDRPNLNLSVSELDAGSWVIFELPGFTTAASGAEQTSLDALRKATATSYYKANGSLWVKLVSSGDIIGSGPTSGPGGGATLQASR